MNSYTKNTLKTLGLLAIGWAIGGIGKRKASMEAYSCGEVSGYCDGVKVTASAYEEKLAKEKEEEPLLGLFSLVKFCRI